VTKSKDDKWLLDAEVQSKIEYVNGCWQVSLIFIDTKDPNHILIREIGDFRSERLAEIAALNMKNTAAKDVRGTQKVDKDAYNFNNN
jgi:hypothetical protein|tara:strand:+ start:324 stop:584 length:261 start_codon:yes stop_codon:yes gene_type:complete